MPVRRLIREVQGSLSAVDKEICDFVSLGLSQLGHSSIPTTKIYTHVSDDALRTTLKGADVLRSLAA